MIFSNGSNKYEMSANTVNAARKAQLLYKRYKRKGMYISGVDSLAELWDWDDSAGKINPL